MRTTHYPDPDIGNAAMDLFALAGNPLDCPETETYEWDEDIIDDMRQRLVRTSVHQIEDGRVALSTLKDIESWVEEEQPGNPFSLRACVEADVSAMGYSVMHDDAIEVVRHRFRELLSNRMENWHPPVRHVEEPDPDSDNDGRDEEDSAGASKQLRFPEAFRPRQTCV